jgi:ParB-like chromosome segregation protein Spo0J
MTTVRDQPHPDNAAEVFEPILTSLEELRPHPRNYRTHPDDQLDHIARSLDLHGFYRNVVVARDGTVLAGHGVVLAARRAGRTHVPVIRLDLDPDDDRALMVLVSDNEIAALAERDDRVLTELLKDLAAEGVEELLGSGYSGEQLAALTMVTRPASEVADMYEAAEWLGLPGFEPAKRSPQVTVKLDSEDDREALLRLLRVSHIHKRLIAANLWVVWWPDRTQQDLSSVRFE